MTSNNHSIRPAIFNRTSGNALPVAAAILVWFFAATVETGYVAVFNTGIQQIDPSGSIA